MNVKPRNTIEIALQVIFLLCLFFQLTRWSTSFIDLFVGLVAVATLALFIIQAIGKSNKPYAAILPVIEIVAFLLSAVLMHRIECMFITLVASTGSYILFYITVADLLLLAAIAIPTYFKAAKLGVAEDRPPANKSSHIGHADELKKLKSLLDCGAITQEEFQAKKEELLK